MIGKTNGNLYAKDGGIEYEQLVNYTMLYDNGYVDGVGWDLGWIAGTATDKGTYIYLYTGTGNNMVRAWMVTKTAYDLVEYNKVYVKLDVLARNANYLNDFALTTSPLSGYNSDSPPTENNSKVPTTGLQIHSMDVSARTDSRYIIYIVDYRNTVNIYNMWMCKKDNWEELATISGITTASSIDSLLTSSELILNNKNAVNFMIKQCTGSFMMAAIQNSTFLTALENSPYKTIIQANEHWNKFLNIVA